MSIHPVVIATLRKLAADADLRAEQLDFRRLAIKSLHPQSGATRVRLAEETRLWGVLAADYRTVLDLIEKEESTIRKLING